MATAEIFAPPEPPETPAKSSVGFSPLTRYLLVRLALVLPMIWVLVTMVFILMRVIGDPITSASAGRLTSEQIAERKADAGFDRPILVQYWEYLSGLFRGDFGTTLTDHRPISDIFVVNGAATLELSIWALIVAFSVGLLLKLAFAPFGWPDAGRASTGAELALQDVSPQTHIMLFDAILYRNTGYIVDVLQHAVLPAIALGLLTGGVFLRLVRVNLLQTLQMDYVTAARTRGVPEERMIRKHAFRNALVPVVTVMGMQMALLLAGAVLTETTFEWPGLGFTLTEYLIRRDFLAVQGIVTLLAVVVGVTSFLIDVIVAFVDPRVRF